MLNYNITTLEKNCTQLAGSLGKELTWKWDPRFETVLAQFDVNDKDKIHNILAKYMDRTWDYNNSSKAPDVVQIIINYFGGLNPGQMILTSDPKQDGCLLCAWWPWKNDKTISIRLGVFADSLNDQDNEELTRLFQGWFRL